MCLNHLVNVLTNNPMSIKHVKIIIIMIVVLLIIHLLNIMITINFIWDTNFGVWFEHLHKMNVTKCRQNKKSKQTKTHKKRIKLKNDILFRKKE